MELKPQAVLDAFAACAEEHVPEYPQAADHQVWVLGIVHRSLFDKNRVEAQKPAIRAMLAELPDPFHADRGEGWSFLNACKDRHDRLWTGEHRTMETLFMLGIAAGYVRETLPYDMLPVLPGGVPYYTIDLKEAA